MTKLWENQGFLPKDCNSVILADFGAGSTVRAERFIHCRNQQVNCLSLGEMWFQE
jgi:hypothetical protein